MIQVRAQIQFPETFPAEMLSPIGQLAQNLLAGSLDEVFKDQPPMWGEHPAPDEVKQRIWSVGDVALKLQGFPSPRPRYPAGHLLNELQQRVRSETAGETSWVVGIDGEGLDEATGHFGPKVFYVDFSGTGWNPTQPPGKNLASIALAAQVIEVPHGYWLVNEIGFQVTQLQPESSLAQAEQASQKRKERVSKRCVKIGGILPTGLIQRAFLLMLKKLWQSLVKKRGTQPVF
ncbi:MAG: hypothetical protein QXI19_03450 [Candidatus Caldarchaeum sp.]